MAKNSPTAENRIQGKTDRVVTECIYRIATGEWLPGSQLPSVRSGRSIWDASELTILRAYRELADLGIVRAEERSGFFVMGGTPHRRITRHRREVGAIYDRIVEDIRDSTDLSVLGTLRWIVRIAEMRARAAPECAFVECTAMQAEAYGKQVAARLDIPCVAITTTELDAGTTLDSTVRTVLTTVFHVHEVSAAVGEHRVLQVPVRWAPPLTPDWLDGLEEMAVFCLDGLQGDVVARNLLADGSVPARVSAQVEAVEPNAVTGRLEGFLGFASAPRPGRSVLLSPTLWTHAGSEWCASPRVVPYGYQIHESAWDEIATAIGLPLGAVP